MRAPRPVVTLATLLIAAASLSACGSSGSDTAASDGKVSIVASTDVYGSIAQAVAGDRATVTSIITSSSQDPHEYEASAQDRLKVGEADIVIENGGGYDPFIDTLLEDADSKATVINAVDVSGLAPADAGAEEGHSEEGHSEEGHSEEGHSEEGHSDEEGHSGHIEGFNEHVFYDFSAMESLADEIVSALSDADPEHAEEYRANGAAFTTKVDALKAEAAKLKAAAAGKGVAITEPVPLYLLDAVGLVNRTPADFSEAVEEGADVPARVLQQTLDLFSGDQVTLLAYNAQASDGTTEQVRAAAEKAGVPVVDFTETLPEGDDYLAWQQANVDALAAALR